MFSSLLKQLNRPAIKFLGTVFIVLFFISLKSTAVSIIDEQSKLRLLYVPVILLCWSLVSIIIAYPGLATFKADRTKISGWSEYAIVAAIALFILIFALKFLWMIFDAG